MRYAMPSLRRMRQDAERRRERPGINVTPAEMDFKIGRRPMGNHQFIAGSIFCVWCRKHRQDAGLSPCHEWKRRNV